MQQLSGQDASFIYSERPHAPTHITSISIYDPSTAPGGSVTFKGILAHLEARLHLARAFRQKVVRVPADLDHPYWVEDEEFDLEYHVRHIALPKPGDWRQFCIQAARLHARPLDLSKPLWELYVIEGLDKVAGVPKGGFAFVLKIHHAAVDGKSGIEMITAIHSQTPDVFDPPPPDTPWRPEPDPSPFELYSRAALNGVRTPARAMRLTGRIVPGLGRAAVMMRNQSDAPAGGMAPGTRFNGPVTAHRVLDAKFFPFAELKPMRNLVEGATVNDVALAVIGGALRTYLEKAGELPDRVAARDDAGLGAHRIREERSGQPGLGDDRQPGDRCRRSRRTAGCRAAVDGELQGSHPSRGCPQPVRAVAIGAGTADRCRHQAGGQVHPARVGQSGQHGRDQRAWSTSAAVLRRGPQCSAPSAPDRPSTEWG